MGGQPGRETGHQLHRADTRPQRLQCRLLQGPGPAAWAGGSQRGGRAPQVSYNHCAAKAGEGEPLLLYLLSVFPGKQSTEDRDTGKPVLPTSGPVSITVKCRVSDLPLRGLAPRKDEPQSLENTRPHLAGEWGGGWARKCVHSRGRPWPWPSVPASDLPPSAWPTPAGGPSHRGAAGVQDRYLPRSEAADTGPPTEEPGSRQQH